MDKCMMCKWLFLDRTVDMYECEKRDLFTDTQDDEYIDNGFVKNCPYFEQDCYYH